MMSTNDKPVVVRLASGAEYGVKDAATAARIYPNGTVVRSQDGTPYEAESVPETPNLSDMKRDELNAYAEKVGVPDPAGLPNIDAVRQAIEDAQS